MEAMTGMASFTDCAHFEGLFITNFCPENESTNVIMHLKSTMYFQGKHSIDSYVDEFRDLIALSGYTDAIAMVVKFRRGLEPSTQDKIAESRRDRPADNDTAGWYNAAKRFERN